MDLSEWERINIFLYFIWMRFLSCISVSVWGGIGTFAQMKIAWEDNHGKRDVLHHFFFSFYFIFFFKDCRSWKIFQPFFIFLLLIFLLRARNWLFVVQIVVMNEKNKEFFSCSSSYIFCISLPLSPWTTYVV